MPRGAHDDSGRDSKAILGRLRPAPHESFVYEDPRGRYLLADATAPFVRHSLQYEWHGQLPPDGRSWRYSEQRARDLDAEGRTVVADGGGVWLKRYLNETRSRLVDDVPDTELSPVEIVVRTMTRKLASLIALNPAHLLTIEWRDLERVMHEVFGELGYASTLTRAGKDGGFDLKLQYVEENQPKTFLVEVKHWAGSGQRPGRKVFKSFFDVVVKRPDTPTGLLLSTTGFTREVLRGRTEVERQVVHLGGKEKIVALCQSYVEETTGLWSPMVGLTDVLLGDTLP